ncbi:hypothetical protein OHA79_31235 [Streptomyces sp. NBC_00841]|uniref:hypothetical protein n=1 Tax=unclassified Streptomyces TaxID=2593676 RepID=UPI00225B546A|nr:MULTISPECIES: hypothetical protein [unclassified Streptomyces]MCX4532592.1 hypothetical protein [Streptomyces sp. NBC_01669]WSA01928.1 hypothetical protein OHA79_31235 [Streptomyces sp. NBC_00841]
MLSRFIPIRCPADVVRSAYVGTYGSTTMLSGVLVAPAFALVGVMVGTRVFRTAGA